MRAMRAALVVACAAAAAAAAAPLPAWSACPAGQGGDDCATFDFPLDRSGAISGTVGVFVRRFYPRDTGPSGKSLWMISGGPGDSGNDFSGGAAFLASELGMTLYTFDQRGIGLSSPINCARPPGFGFDPYNATFLDEVKACNQEIIDAQGAAPAKRLACFSTVHAATDLVDIVAAVNPDSVYVYALSYGTFFTNTYLQLPGMRVDALILDGPVAPDRWPLENNAEWTSHVHGDLLRACADNSPACAARLGVIAHLPRLTMDAVIDGTLPCVAADRLSWLTSQLVAGWAAYLTADVGAHVLAGPMWHRLLRCSATDRAQLEHFARFRAAANAPDPNLKDIYTYGLSVVRGASELYSFANASAPVGGGPNGGPLPPLSYAGQKARSKRMLSDAHPELVASFARDVSLWPVYTPDPATYRKYAVLPTGLPALLMVGTLDPQTPHGLGLWFQRGLGGEPAIRLITVPWAAHGTVNPIYPCSLGIAQAFFRDPRAPLDTGCLQRLAIPDFDGAKKATQALSLRAFGTADLWNGPVDGTPSPLPSPLHAVNASDSGITSSVLAGSVVGGALVGSALTLAGGFIWQRRQHHVIGRYLKGAAGAGASAAAATGAGAAATADVDVDVGIKMDTMRASLASASSPAAPLSLNSQRKTTDKPAIT